MNRKLTNNCRVPTNLLIPPETTLCQNKSVTSSVSNEPDRYIDAQ